MRLSPESGIRLANGNCDPIARHILLIPGRRACKTIVFTGIDEASDSSKVSIRTARSIASRVEGRVCLVDANWGSPRVHKALNLPDGQGFSHLVRTTAPIREYTHAMPRTNLAILSPGAFAGELSLRAPRSVPLRVPPSGRGSLVEGRSPTG